MTLYLASSTFLTSLVTDAGAVLYVADGVQKREILDLKSMNKLLPGEFIGSLSDPSES